MSGGIASKETRQLIDDLSEVAHHMNDWEREFVVSMNEKLDRYNEDLFVSDKQLQVLDRLQEKYL